MHGTFVPRPVHNAIAGKIYIPFQPAWSLNLWQRAKPRHNKHEETVLATGGSAAKPPRQCHSRVCPFVNLQVELCNSVPNL